MLAVIAAMTSLGFSITNSMVVIWIVGLSLRVVAQVRREILSDLSVLKYPCVADTN